MKSQVGKAYLELHTAIFLFGFTGILGRLISLDAVLLVWYRMGLTALGMLAVCYFTGSLKILSGKQLITVTAVSSTITMHWLLFYGTIKFASVSVAMICLSAITLFTALLEPLIFRKRISKLQILFSSFAILGVWLMSGSQESGIYGVLLGLASAFFSALFTVLNKKILPAYNSRNLAFHEITCGFILLTLCLPAIQSFFQPGEFLPGTSDWIYLILLSFFCTVVAFNLSLSSLRFLSPFTSNLALNLEPVYGIALAFIVFKEYELLDTGFYLGSLCIMLTVAGELYLKYRSRKLAPA